MTAADLKAIFETQYNRADWQRVLREQFGVARLAAKPELTGGIKSLKGTLATSACELGSLDAGGRLIGLYEVQVAPKVQLHRNRVGLRELLGKVIRDTVDGALIVFVQGDKWRFSYVSEVWTRDAAGNRVQKKTDPRRYTYLLGKGERAKTAADRFATIGKPAPGRLDFGEGISLEALEAAFNVEKMSKKFFDEYRAHYDKFVAYLTGEDRKGRKVNNASPALRSAFNGDQKEARDFVKKLLGRIVFLYFLEKKGWLGVPEGKAYGEGDEDFLHRLFRDFREPRAFYAGALVPLFFETLNKKRPGDRFAIDPALFRPTDVQWDTLKIPFLNGGLFEHDGDDKLAIVFPKEYFGELFRFFDQYNFTVYEDSPEEHTVAVDPEMLGHIFENLLEDNKDKGAFYTPKEIVHYMCQESLIEYLCAALGKAGDKARPGIQSFIREGLAGGVVAHAEELLGALRRVKVCDPAIGSGAFPMGLLLEILHAVEVLWDASPDVAARIWDISAAAWQPALVKAAIIQHSIYGVDIEQGAVDIARLRFWLSLVVDEDKPQPLPNLDYKIMVGNSLISKYGDQVIDIDWEVKFGGAITDITKKAKALQESVAKKLDQLFKKQQQYFDYKGDKQKLQGEIRDLKIDVLIAQLQLNKYKADGDKVSKGDLFAETARATQKKAASALHMGTAYSDMVGKLIKLKEGKAPLEYFDWKLDFPEVMNEELAEKVGFDIVIGNPPYFSLSTDSEDIDAKTGKKLKHNKRYESRGYLSFASSGDIYTLFYEKGWQLLKPKGHLAFITSNKWMRAGYGENTRKFFAEHTNPMLLVDFAGQKIFESATVDTNILLFAKDKNQQQTHACTVKEKVLGNLSDYVRQEGTPCTFRGAESWVILNGIEQRIIAKIEAVGTPLKDWDINIYRGVLTGYNEAFIIDGAKRAELISEDPKSAEIIRPILRGRDIKRYKYEYADLYIIATFPSLNIDIEQYPAVKQHLLSYGYGRLKQTGEEGARKKTNNKWFETQDSIGYWEDFDRQKIVWGEISDRTKFCMDVSGDFVTEATTFLMTGNSLPYLFGYLNSRLSEYLFSKIGTTTGVGTVRWKKFTIEQLLVPKISKEAEVECNALIAKILEEVSTAKYIKELDRIMYSAFSLNSNEIKFIENTASFNETN